jgi:hypothetical protein
MARKGHSKPSVNKDGATPSPGLLPVGMSANEAKQALADFRQWRPMRPVIILMLLFHLSVEENQIALGATDQEMAALRQMLDTYLLKESDPVT